MTEREHERMVSELTVKHSEELSQLKTELSLELRESMEAAHQAELQQAQVYCIYTTAQCNILSHSMLHNNTSVCLVT